MKSRWVKKLTAIGMAAVIGISTAGCSLPFGKKEPEIKQYEETKAPDTSKEAEKMEWEEAVEAALHYMSRMTLEEKVGQLFVVNLEQLDNSKGNYYEFQKVTKKMKKTLEQYPVGGVILFSRNLSKRKQVAKLNRRLQKNSKIPLFVSVDEEGGTVARVASNEKLKTTKFPSAEQIGQTEDDEYVYEMGKTIGGDIKKLGFNVDFAPVADVKTSELNMEIGDRSFGDDAEKVAQFVSAFVQGLEKENISATVKHFPGQGSSNGDTHIGSVDIDSSIASLRKTDFVPFEAGIAAGADFVMVSHISVSKVTETAEPASMSELIMQTILREELGFEKIIITDAFDMASITDNYTSAEAAVEAIKSGADIVLMPQNYKEAYEAVLNKVKDGTFSEEKINDSVIRILAVKIQRNLITQEQIEAAESETMQTPVPVQTPE